MKKVVIFISVLFFAVAMLSSCGSSSTNSGQDAYKNASADQEFLKDYMAIKILELDGRLNNIDAFGDSLRVNHWYIRSNKTLVLFPIKLRNVNGRLNVSDDQLNILSYPLSLQKHRKEKTEVVIRAGHGLGVNLKVEVLVLGPDKITLTDSYKNQEVWVK